MNEINGKKYYTEKEFKEIFGRDLDLKIHIENNFVTTKVIHYQTMYAWTCD